MKKYCAILILMLMVIFSFGCTNTPQIVENPDEEYLNKVTEMLTLPSEISKRITLPKEIEYDGDCAYINWKTSNKNLLDLDGRIVRDNYNHEVILTATITYNGLVNEKKFTITILGYNAEEQFNMIIPKINIPETLSEDLLLPTKVDGFDVTLSWKSSNEEVLTNTGKYNEPAKMTTLVLTLTLTLNETTKEVKYELTTLNSQSVEHIVIEKANEFDSAKFNNVKLNGDNHLELSADALEGSYESNIINTRAFTSMVGSWSCKTGLNQTIEVLFRVNVNGLWSDYLSYGEWGLGRTNVAKSVTTKDGLAKMSTDELMVCNGKTASQIQYKVVLKRDKISDKSPVLSLVAMALEIPGYNYVPSKAILSTLPDKVDYDVPKLNQNVVPKIGNIICSATSSTMLLKYKGLDFTLNDAEYEHRYVAGLVYDSGHKIYGNWVYNVAVLGSFGFEAYVKRMYSLEELKYHLFSVGPIAASVKGNMQGYYNTNGHLIVIRGYEVVDGVTYFICNDPNLKDVEVRYSEVTIKNVWRNIAYVIE